MGLINGGGGRAFKLKTDLRRLAAKWDVTPTAINIPWREDTPFPQLLAGVCSDITTIDADRLCMTKGALQWDEKRLPPLLYRHQPNVIAGRVLGLKRRGPELWCGAWVGHHLARRCTAFSVSVRVDDAEILHAESADYFARILRC